MRRSSLAIFLVALALLSRLLAPLAVEARGFDPLVDAPICTHDGGVSGSADRGDVPTSAHTWCELSCCQVAPGFAAVPPSTFVQHRAAKIIVWQHKNDASVARQASTAHRARGPPNS